MSLSSVTQKGPQSVHGEARSAEAPKGKIASRGRGTEQKARGRGNRGAKGDSAGAGREGRWREDA